MAEAAYSILLVGPSRRGGEVLVSQQKAIIEGAAGQVKFQGGFLAQVFGISPWTLSYSHSFSRALDQVLSLAVSLLSLSLSLALSLSISLSLDCNGKTNAPWFQRFFKTRSWINCKQSMSSYRPGVTS